ncbi:cytosine/adenosine deaminase-related metal-dependent hydrolase [Amycolatopsis bartoniae]|uniref:TRZ/ATZ family hydrolase n=1 Tax=Amycolatopsis bartoniae TaxID=941986 RepID=A0A8H9J6B7_9PSEU|nr:amidohydrolase family protein [Amycolatopsis bartoniae]MBB2939376.1 cytosine/adenosine deaminase-related metal-dependent hydrolase [Amycolatopsis bartoniae]TVT06701.1 amidohydrolase family protein [Amycolatopsis bartoniae]GHF83473.1 TRZ/ATZ family hydrolase [Amycolatopsis bartoniae]
MTTRIVLRGAQIITMDPATGVLPEGDVLIEDGVIAAVAPHLDVEDADIVDIRGHVLAPGMVDTHRHTWQTQMRAICADWTLADYFYGIRLAVSPSYTPEDVHLGNKLGALEALNAGVTTVLDFSHCNNTPEHSDAAVTGLRESGVRAKFCYGFFESSPYAPPHFADHAARVRDFERIAGTYFSGDGLVTLGVALNELGLVPFSNTRTEIELARAHDALIATHMACVWQMPSGFDEIARAGLLGPDQVHIHCNALTDDQWRQLADAGAKVSISVETELNMGMGRPVFAKCEEFGVKPTLSCDVVSLNSGDLASQARLGIAFKRWADTEHLNLAGKDVERVTTTALQALEWSTVNGAEACGLGDVVGSITVGKQADLMVVGGPGIGQHPVVDAPGTVIFQTTPSDVRHVLVAGNFVKRDGVLVGHDLPKLLAEADESASRVLERIRSAGGPFPATPAEGFDETTALALANLAG